MDGGSKPLLSGLNGCRLGLNRGGNSVVPRFALHSCLRQSGCVLRTRLFYGTAEAVPFRFLLPCGLWVGWASDPTHDDETVMNGAPKMVLWVGRPSVRDYLMKQTGRSIVASIPHLKSEIWGTRFRGGSDVGHPP